MKFKFYYIKSYNSKKSLYFKVIIIIKFKFYKLKSKFQKLKY